MNDCARVAPELVADYRGLTVTGLSEALAVLPRSYAIYRRLVARARAERPDVFVAIDFPEINFRLARAVRALGIPVVYYIVPQVWAWRRGRLRTLKQLVSHALVIFPFEEPILRDAGISVEFVGHPLLELSAPAEGREAFSVPAWAQARGADRRAVARESRERARGNSPRDHARGA